MDKDDSHHAVPGGAVQPHEPGADVNAKDKNGLPALTQAVISDQRDAVAALLEAGADVHATDPSGATALLHAAALDRVHLAKVLLDWDADIHWALPDGATALLLAAKEGHAHQSRASDTSDLETACEFDGGASSWV